MLFQKNVVKKEGDINNYLEHIACNLCGSDAYKVLFASTLCDADFQNSHAHYIISQKSPHCGQIVQCKQCGLVYVNPREKTRDILCNYTMVHDEAYLTEEREREKTFLRGLHLLESYCPHKGALLDVGCFAGLFLGLARRHGWSVLGVEPSHWAVAYAKEKLNLNLLQGAFEDLAFQFRDESFDAVTMWDVIEHLPEPKLTLTTLYKKLKTRGILFLNTFNYDSIFRKIFNRKYWFIERMHIYYFTARTIRMMLEDCNYEVLSIVPHFKTLSLGYYIRRFKDTSNTLARIMAPVSSLFLMRECSITAYVGQMTIIGRKKE